MCGICGEYRAGGTADAARVATMRDALRHRGPDGCGAWAEGPIALGHVRLAIIDLSADGLQPMANEDGSVRIVYNGEIYNFAELRAELVTRGHRFRSRTDTEVIVHGYEEWDLGVLDRLNAIFAFALWDGRRRKLILARDRFGVKPLYVAERAGAVLFASEAKALVGPGGVLAELNRAALGPYLALGYVPGPASFFRGIEQVPPATVVEYLDGRRSQRCWWRIEDEVAGQADEVDEPRALEHYGALVQDAVRRQMVSDVPVGLFLSGGIDSSTLVVGLRGAGVEDLRTFSMGFEDPGYDELPAAHAVARHLRTRHTEELVRPRVAEDLPKIVRALDEPLADESALALWNLCRLARRSVTVALAGEGGDELFGGYTRYVWDAWARRWGGLSSTLRAGTRWLLDLLPWDERRGWRAVARRARKFARTADLPEAERYLEWFALLDAERRHQLCTAGATNGDPFTAWFARDPFAGGLRRLQWVDLGTYLAGDLLAKADRLSMAHGLELRVPLLDHRLVAFSFSLADRLKVRQGQTKWLMRRWLEGRVPREIIHRPKQGFEVPIGGWLRGPLREMTRDLLSERRVRERGLVGPKAVARLLDELETGAADHGRAIVALLVLELWMQAFGVE